MFLCLNFAWQLSSLHYLCSATHSSLYCFQPRTLCYLLVSKHTFIYSFIFHAALPFHPVLSCLLCIVLDHFTFGCLTFTSFLISVLVLMLMQMLVLLRCSQSILSCLPMALLQSMV